MSGIIGYCRVSTKEQGKSGLGLDAQRTAIEAYAAQTSSRLLVPLYIEVESGKRNDRPELAKAIAHAKRAKATLVIAKLDRLSRNVAFLANLLESKVPFICCDNPQANTLTIHILAAVAEEEARAISKRTKDSLAAAKARGTLLGSARPGHWSGKEDKRRAGAEAGNKASATARKRLARDAYSDLLPMVHALRQSGMSLAAIAARLNEDGHTTRRGARFNAVQVARLLAL